MQVPSFLIISSGGNITHAGIAATFGLIVLTVIYAYGDISGAHIKLAVTIGFWGTKRFPLKLVRPYIIAQCIGTIAAAMLLKLLVPIHETYGATLPTAGIWQIFILESVLSWWLMTVILRVSHRGKEKLEALFADPLTGASMNPAISLGPALISNNLSELWTYLVAPVIGAMLATVSYRFVSNHHCC